MWCDNYAKKESTKNILLFLGAGGLGKALIEQIRKSPESGYQVLSLFDNDQSLWEKR